MKAEWALSDAEDQEIEGLSFKIIFEVNLKQIVRYISFGIKMLIGYDPNDIVGKVISNFVILSDLPKMDDAFQRVILEEITEQ